jgi:hypothetical protein
VAKKAGGKSEEDMAGDDNDKLLSLSSTAMLVNIKVQRSSFMMII